MPKKTMKPNFKPDFYCAKCGADCWGGLSQVIGGKIYCLKCAKEIKRELNRAGTTRKKSAR